MFDVIDTLTDSRVNTWGLFPFSASLMAAALNKRDAGRYVLRATKAL